MAVLAAQTRLQRSERQLALTHAARAVTVEARRNFLVRRQPPHGFRQVVRPYLLVSHGDPQRRRLLVVGRQALVEVALVFQYERQVVNSERISNRQSQRTGAVTYRSEERRVGKECRS